MRLDKVVLDTNVVVSALYKSDSNPGAIIQSIMDGEIVIFFNEPILAEYDEVLSRIRLHIDKKEKVKILDLIQIRGAIFEPVKSSIEMADEDDRVFFDTANQARVILVTGNTRHYPEQEFIMTPAEYVMLIKK